MSDPRFIWMSNLVCACGFHLNTDACEAVVQPQLHNEQPFQASRETKFIFSTLQQTFTALISSFGFVFCFVGFSTALASSNPPSLENLVSSFVNAKSFLSLGISAWIWRQRKMICRTVWRRIKRNHLPHSATAKPTFVSNHC